METGPGGRVEQMGGGASMWEWGKQGIKSHHLGGLATPLKAPERTGNLRVRASTGISTLSLPHFLQLFRFLWGNHHITNLQVQSTSDSIS